MSSNRTDVTVAAALMSAILFWGANNVALKYLNQHWPPVWIGSSRMLCVGLLLFSILHWTRWLGPTSPISPTLRKALWLRSSVIFAIYILLYTLAIRFTSPARVALYFGTGPVWALFFEGKPAVNWDWTRRYAAAALACSGVAVLFWPKLHDAAADWLGDALSLVSCIVWVIYSRECKRLGGSLSGTEVTAHTMWGAGVWLLPFAAIEFSFKEIPIRPGLIGAQAFSVVFSGTLSFIFYNFALRHWPMSRVFLFGNLIPVSTMAWAWLLMGDAVTGNFWIAMALVVSAVVLGQKIEIRALGNRWIPTE